MKPLKIEVEGFRTFQDKLTLDLTQFSSVSVTGPNGSGKSTLFIDGLLFALKGKARKLPESLINDLCDSMTVTLWLDHNGCTYQIQRGLQRGKTQSLKLWCDDVDISERLLTNTQAKLDGILNISYELLLSTSIAQQEDINKLSEMGATDREKIISEMLNIEQWEQKKKKVNEKLNEYKDLDKNIKDVEVILETKNTELISLESELKKSESKKLISQQLKNEKQIRFDEFNNKFKEYQEYISLKNKLENLKTELKLLEQQIKIPDKDTPTEDDLTLKIKTNLSTIDENLKTVTEIETGLVELQVYITDTARWESEARQLTISETQISILDEVPCKGLDIHDTCKLLKSALDVKKQVDTLISISGLKTVKEFQILKFKELEELSEKKKLFNNSKNNLLQENKDLINKNTLLTRTINDIKKDSDNLKLINEKIINIKNKISEYTLVEPDFNKDNFIIIQSELNNINMSLTAIESEVSKYTTQIQYNEKTKADNTKLLQQYKNLEEQLANYKVLQQAYSDIPSLLFEEAIPTLEIYSNEILEKIFPGERISLRSFRETKSNTLQKSLDVVGNTATGQRDFYDLSGSEKFRQSLALRLALSRYNSERNGTKVAFFIVDEGFGNLDDNNRYAMKLMLKNIANNFELFIIITHLDDLKDTFDKQIIINPSGKAQKLQII